jgi:hypothetical protein
MLNLYFKSNIHNMLLLFGVGYHNSEFNKGEPFIIVDYSRYRYYRNRYGNCNGNGNNGVPYNTLFPLPLPPLSSSSSYISSSGSSSIEINGNKTAI